MIRGRSEMKVHLDREDFQEIRDHLDLDFPDQRVNQATPDPQDRPVRHTYMPNTLTTEQ